MSSLLGESFSFFMGGDASRDEDTQDDQNSWINDIIGQEQNWSVTNMSGLLCGGGNGSMDDVTDDDRSMMRKRRTRTLWVRVRTLGQLLRKKGILQQILISRLVESVQEIEPTLTGLLDTIAKNAQGELVGLDFKFKTKESLGQKVARDVYEANLMLLEELEKQRMVDKTVVATEQKRDLEQQKLRRRSMTLLSGLQADEEGKAAAIVSAKHEAEILANFHLAKANEAVKAFEAKIAQQAQQSVDVEAVVWNISDALRYTVLVPTERYTAAVKDALKVLEDHGMTPAKLKNYWGEGDGYQGINDVFYVPCEMSPTGKVKVEIQFHTPESFKHKMAVHGMYEEFRSTRDPTRKVELWKESVAMADEIPVPKGVLELPKLTTQPMPIENTLYVDLVLSRSLKIQKSAVNVVARMVTNLKLEVGSNAKVVSGKVTSFLMSPSAVEKRLNNEIKNAKNMGQEIGLKEAALNILESLVVTVVFETEDYATATEISLNRLFKDNELKESKSYNSWNMPMVLERTGPVGGVGVQCIVHMDGEDDGVAFTPDDAYPLVIAFHTQESLTARIGLQAAWSEYRAANTGKQREAALSRGRKLVEGVRVPDGARSLLTNRWMVDGSGSRSVSLKFMEELNDKYEAVEKEHKQTML